MESPDIDLRDLTKLKNVMLAKGLDGDPLAASAYASLINAETLRSAALAATSQGQTPALSKTRERNASTPWLDRVAIEANLPPGHPDDVQVPS